MPITTASSLMFDGITGVYGICLSATAAVSAFAGPMVARYVPFNVCTIILTVASVLAYVVCTLPQPLNDATGQVKAGPVIGTMLAGFVYAFGTQNYLTVAAFFPSEAVVALSTGSGLAISLGAGLFIGLMNGPFPESWRKCYLVIAPTALLMPLVWWCLFDKTNREAAESSRRRSLKKEPLGLCNTSSDTDDKNGLEAEVVEINITESTKPGFGPHRSRTSFLFMTILPRYVLPLIICTTCAIFCLFGLAPSIQDLNRFPDAPKGDLQFQLVFFAYGSAQFLFSALVAVQPIPIIWIWTGIEVVLTTIVFLQIWYPFLKSFWVWWFIMFLVGGCVGGSVTNTNYKISQDFRKAGEPDEVRSYANSYAGLGNFGGDALGGAIGLVVQLVIIPNLLPTT
ncbi:hypothetical protein F4860DRAFT_503493 [Xylaria cubensis]|nr:hypothetical protein F4860DRAFT_503493 [Xylaria cubensis]